MAIAGDLNKKINLKAPSSTVNNEGGREKTHSTSIATRAAVKRVGQGRVTDVGSSLVDSIEFMIRWRAALADMTKDWLVEYNNENYTIHSLEKVNEGSEWLKINGKVRTNG